MERRTGTVLAIAGAWLLAASTMARAGEVTLQNETLVDGTSGAIQLGFIAGDIGAAVLEAPTGDYPLDLLRIQILIADSSGLPLNTVRDYVITVYDNGNVNPGTPIFTSAPTTLGANVFTELDVSAQGIQFASGPFTIGARAVSGSVPAEPNLVTSLDGCQSGKNRIFDTFTSTWFDGCTLGISGQLAIRAVVSPNGGGGSGDPPSISILVPDSGDPAGGDTVTVFGDDFESGATVSFDGVDAPSVIFLSPNALEVVTPPGSGGPADVEVCNPGDLCDTAIGAFTYEELECLAGAVTPTTDVLFLNGSSGGGTRTVPVAEGGIVLATMLQPPSPGNGKFLVHANVGLPNSSTQVELPAGIGIFCFEALLSAGADPDAVWNNIGKEEQVGDSRYFDGSPLEDPARAPVTFLELFYGDPTFLPSGTSVTFQGVIVDLASPSPKLAATTNAVVLEVQ